MTDPVLAALAAIAREEWTRRRERAVAKVASGDLRPSDAKGFLTPWLAIACRCGVDLPDLAEPLAEVLSTPGSREGGSFYTEAEARVEVANLFSPIGQIRETLAAAREDALRRSERAPKDAAKLARARGLCSLASHFGVPMQWRAATPAEQVSA